MARKLRSTVATEVAAANTVTTGDRSFEVEGVRSVAIESRRVVTVDQPGFARVVADESQAETYRDSIIRVQPPADATEADIDRVVGALRSVGASVRLAPRATADAVVPRNAVIATSTAGVREVVMQMVGEARLDPADREELRVVIDAALTAEGV